MAIAATAFWRVRTSGVNTNGGGFDCSLSSAATGTHGSFTGTTFTDATAAAFTSGMTNSSINISGIGQYLITAFISATQVTLGSGNPALTLAGPLTWSVGAGTDYSQQNAAQATGTNGATSGAGSTTFTDATAAAFTSAMVGNCIQIASGTNFQTGFYFVTSFTNANSVVLDRTPSSGGAGSAGVWKLGGGWADFWTNTQANIVAGNTVYILGSGTPNPSSYTTDYTSIGFSPASGNTTDGAIAFANDPATPGYKAPPDTTGGMPLIKGSVNGGTPFFDVSNHVKILGLWLVSQSASSTAFNSVSSYLVFGCVFDQNAKDAALANFSNTSEVIGCELFNSGAGTGSGTQIAGVYTLVGCNIHDTLAGAIIDNTQNKVINCIIAKNGGDGINKNGGDIGCYVNNTIDGNAGHGINISAGTANFGNCSIINNIISNHTGVGKFGLTIGGGTATQNSSVNALADYNTYYNNTANYNAIYGGPHDTALAVTPYVGSATENYTLA